jgi:hypothetical protein
MIEVSKRTISNDIFANSQKKKKGRIILADYITILMTKALFGNAKF